MAAQDTYTGRVRLPAQAPTILERALGVGARWRERYAQAKTRRLVSSRSRCALARRLRRTANCAHDPHPLVRRRAPLLHHRAAGVRAELLELAIALERAQDPAPESVAALHRLLADGCGSPLYNADVPARELHATIRRVGAGLVRKPRA
jgi:hypothetical protein